MKKVLVCAMAIGLAATAADATVLRLNFAGGGNTATIFAGGTVDVQVWADLYAGDAISGIGFQMEAQPLVTQSAHSVTMGVDGSNGDGPLGLLTDWGCNYSPIGNLTGSGAKLLGTMTMTSAVVGTYELVINHNSVAFLDGTGGSYPFKLTYAGYSGFLAYGNWGGPAYGKGTEAQLRNPLFLNVEVPEPTSLVLLAIGGLAAIRRR